MLVSGSGPQKWINLVSRCPTKSLRNQFLPKVAQLLEHKVQRRTGSPTPIAGVYLCVCVCVCVCIQVLSTSLCFAYDTFITSS